jgi:hypothetical protein
MIMTRASVCLFAAALALFAQGGTPDTAQQIAQIRESIAANQARLRGYTWVETTEMSLKGELKKREQQDCRYAPDGAIVKTPVGAPAGAKPPGGLRGKMAAKKGAEMREYLDRAHSLAGRYVPLNPQQVQAAIQAGRCSLERDQGAFVSLICTDYVKPHDRLTLVFDSSHRAVRRFEVATWLDDPGDAVTVSAAFAGLPDGTRYLDQSELYGKAKEVRIKTTNFGYRKTGE